MNKTIVTESSSNIRKLARQGLSGKWKIAVLAVLLLNVALEVPSILITTLFPSGAVVSLANMYSFLVTGPLTLGVMMVFLNIFRGRQTSPLEVFNGFEYMVKTFGLFAVTWFFTALWSLLFVIPGIVASYRYKQAYFILADDPTKGIFQCINESKYLMAGNKGKAFGLDLSFIGWSLLCAIPVGIFAGVVAADHAEMIKPGMDAPQAFLALRTIPWVAVATDLLGIGYLWLYSYMYTAGACLYDMINGNLTVRRVVNEGEETYSTVAPEIPVTVEAKVIRTEDAEETQENTKETEKEE